MNNQHNSASIFGNALISERGSVSRSIWPSKSSCRRSQTRAPAFVRQLGNLRAIRGREIILAGLVWLAAWLGANDVRAQGALTNGFLHTGTVSPVGDSDSWTFSANVGDSIVIRVGEISQTNN